MIDPSSRTAVIERAKDLAKRLNEDRYVFYNSHHLGYVTRAQPPYETFINHWKVTPKGEVFRHVGGDLNDYRYTPVTE